MKSDTSLWDKAMKVYKTTVTDIAVKPFGGLLNKMKDTIEITYLLDVQEVK